MTPLENHLRQLGGEAGYAGDFIERLVTPLLYPDSLTLEWHYLLGLLLLAVNAEIYAFVMPQMRRMR